MIGARCEELAKEAFSRMDVHLDLNMTMIRHLDGIPQVEYLKEFGDIYKRLETRLEPVLVNQEQWKRDRTYLSHEDRMVVPSNRIRALLKWTHDSSGHVGASRTLGLFKQWFHSTWTDDQLRKTLQPIVDKCPCRSCKPGDIRERGLYSTLPIPGCAVGPVLGPHAPMDRTRDTRVAEPWLPAPEDGRPEEGQRLTPGARHNGCRPTPLGTAPHQPRGMQPPQGMQAKGTVLGQHTDTPAPTARGWPTSTAQPVGGQLGEGQRLTSDAPHNGGRHPPRGRPSATPTASKAGPQGRKLWGRCWVLTPAPTAPGNTGRGALAARSRGRAARGGSAPDTRRPSERWQATPPGDGPPPPPRHTAPKEHAGQGDSVGPPHAHTRAHSTLVADPNGPPSGRAVGRGTAPDLSRPSQWWKAPPPGTPFRRPHSEQRRPARAHAVGLVLGPHARTDRTRGTRVAEPWPPAPEDGRPGEGQRLTPDAPQSGGRPPPPRGQPPATPAARSPHRACRPRGQCWAPTPEHPRPQHVGGGPQQPAQWAGGRGRDSA